MGLCERTPALPACPSRAIHRGTAVHFRRAAADGRTLPDQAFVHRAHVMISWPAFLEKITERGASFRGFDFLALR